MRYLFIFLTLIMTGVGCRDQDAILPLDTPVASLDNLPTTYQLFQGGSVVPGRLKSVTQNGILSGEWRYNDRGQLLEWRRFRLGRLTSSNQYRYDAAGKLRFVQQFDDNCGFSSYSHCTGPVVWTGYSDLTTDAAGRVTESRSYLKLDGKWDFRSTTTHEYNTQGQIIKVLRYNDKRELTLTQMLTYDTRGNVVAIREQSNASSPDFADRTFKYDYDIGQNPYFNTVYFAAPFFLSRNIQLTPGLTYEYRSDGLPIRIRQNGSDTELTYY